MVNVALRPEQAYLRRRVACPPPLHDGRSEAALTKLNVSVGMPDLTEVCRTRVAEALETIPSEGFVMLPV